MNMKTTIYLFIVNYLILVIQIGQSTIQNLKFKIP